MQSTPQEIAQGLNAYRKLNWNDFQIRSSASGERKAYTGAYIQYSYNNNYGSTNGSYWSKVTSVTVRSGIDLNRTWRWSGLTAADMAKLLPHEQGHLDINEIEARRLRAIPLSGWPAGTGTTRSAAEADLRRKLQAIFDQAIQRVQSRNRQYDQETRHGIVQEEQERWNKILASGLRAAQ